MLSRVSITSLGLIVGFLLLLLLDSSFFNKSYKTFRICRAAKKIPKLQENGKEKAETLRYIGRQNIFKMGV
jgi:hypothetical protein